MARTVEDDDDQILNVAVEPLGDGFEIIGDGGIEVDRTLAGRTNYNFFHVQIGSVQQSALLTRGQNGDGAGGPSSAKISALERIYGDVDFREQSFGRVGSQANLFADVKHGSFVAFAFADDDGAVHLHGVHRFAHGLDGDFVSLVAVAESHGARGSDGAVLDHAQEFQAELLFHTSLRKQIGRASCRE